jgi:hypothetical protein
VGNQDQHKTVSANSGNGGKPNKNKNLQDARSAREKAIDEWLPITSSRNAKWWYSAFHNVTAMVGAGVLSLPYALSELGWYAHGTSSRALRLRRPQTK